MARCPDLSILHCQAGRSVRYTVYTVRRFPFLFLPVLLLLPQVVPAAQDTTTGPSPIVWRSDYLAARQEAITSGKPLFVLFRCPRVRDERALDLRVASPKVSELLAQRFITVRFSTLKGIDLDTFQFDYDLDAAALVLDPVTGKTLARWGSRKEQEATGGLIQALRKVAAGYTPGVGQSSTAPPRTITDKYPRFGASRRAKEACYHCHYAQDARFAQARADGTFTQAMLYLFPPPENIGITLDREVGNKVKQVKAVSPAAKAGVRAGDTITQAGDTRVYSSADLQWALNAVPDAGKITLRLSRENKPLPPFILRLVPGWRKTDVSWRASQGGVPPFIGTWETPLTAEEKTPLGIAADRLALRVTFLFSGAVWKMAQSDLRKGDVIIAVGGKTPLLAMTAQQFHTYIRLHYKVGDTLPLTVLREGRRVDVSVPCVEVSL